MAKEKIKLPKEEVLKETDVDITENIPWLTEDKLEEKISIRRAGWGRVSIKQFTRSSWAATWNVDYTGFWFTPTSYMIDAWTDSATPWISHSWMVDWTLRGNYMRNVWWVENVFNLASRVICVYDWAWFNTIADPVSIIPDWIRVNYISNGLTIYFTITAFE